MTDPMLRYIDRVLREQQMFELQREMQANMLAVEQIIENAAPVYHCDDEYCEWCFHECIPATREKRDIQGNILAITRLYFDLSPKEWENGIRNILPFRTEIKNW